MIRFIFMTPKVEINSTKTYSFLTGINVYTGLGIHGIVISILGFGFILEKWRD